jgi:hypothetical protein
MVLTVRFFIKINGTWINHRLSFVGRYLGVRLHKIKIKIKMIKTKTADSIEHIFKILQEYNSDELSDRDRSPFVF